MTGFATVVCSSKGTALAERLVSFDTCGGMGLARLRLWGSFAGQLRSTQTYALRQGLKASGKQSGLT